MKMKVVFEFTDEERSQAEDAFRGTEYRLALYKTRELLRNTLKFAELNKTQRATIIDIQKQFLEITSDLSLD